MAQSMFDEIIAVTLVTRDMAESLAFYQALGFDVAYGGANEEFSTLRCGRGFLNIQLDRSWQPPTRVWGRTIIWVADVDAMYRRVVDAGHGTETTPADAPWGERYFHVRDPDGHELSFAHPLR